MARKKVKAQAERPMAPISVELQIARAAIKWELAVRRFRDTTDRPSGPQLAGRRRSVKMASTTLRRLASMLIDK